METPELFMKPSMAPIYITSTNMVTPLIPNHLITNTLITFKSFYINTLIVMNMLFNIVGICIQTLFLIMKEIFLEVFTNMTVVKMVYIIGIYNLFMLAVLDNQQKKIAKQKEQIESLEKQVRHLKKADKVRDDFEQLWIHDIKSYNQETTKKMISIEKKIKKIEKEFK
jgi:hypothetical protein